MPTVFLGCPTYGESLTTGAAKGVWGWATQRDDVRIMACSRGSSLIPGSCNVLLCEAINAGADWFAMLHADITPEFYWVDKLLAESERVNADMLSVAVPVKDHRGLTSHAIASGREREIGQFARLTQRQIWHPNFPETFDIESCAAALESLPDGLRIPNVPRVGLSLNTGCMIVRLKRPWFAADPPQVYFENIDWIEWHNGKLRQRDISEDWRFAERLRNAGGRLFGTRIVSVEHRGEVTFPNNTAWGDVERDTVLAVREAA